MSQLITRTPQVSRPVLVVEDNEDSRQMMCEFLQVSGFSCVGASGGQAALVALKDHRPWLILLDLMMPGMDGPSFREAQQRLEDPGLASIPVVILSARTDLESFQLRMGAAGFVYKPVDLDRLLALLHHLLPIGKSQPDGS